MQNHALRSRQWRQLLALTFAHLIADVYVGLIAPVMIPMRDRYDVSLTALIVITSLLAFSANVFQVPIGCLRATWTRPWLICGGVLLAGVSVFIPCLPVGPGSVIGMGALAVLAGLGVAAVHPEGLRAVHGLDAISSSLSTAVFMVAGFMGFSGGALLSATLTEHFGLDSLMILYLLAPMSIIPLLLSGVRLPVESAKPQSQELPSAERERTPIVPFVTLFAMASVLAICSQIQSTLLPSYLHEEANYSLSFSGLSVTLFGVGGMVGAVFWGALAPRLGHLRVLLGTALAGAPLTVFYLWLAPQTQSAAAVLAFTGFIVYTGFPLCIALARYADSSLRVSQRMGLISGGTWGIAAVMLWIIGPIVERVGMRPLLHLIWFGYLAVAAITFSVGRSMFSVRRS